MEWVKVTDGLPEKPGTYLVCKRYKGINTNNVYKISEFTTINGIPNFYKFSGVYGWIVDRDIVAWSEFKEFEDE